MSGRRVIVIGVCAVALAVASVFFFHKIRSSGADNIFNSAPTVAITETAEAREPPDGWSAYHSSLYRFSLFYPEELAVNERPEGDGAATITFQNIEKGMGFQIFIIPYAEPQVSEERFKKDVPSGMQQGLENIQVDGVTGAAFHSTNALLGETRELWFIRDGLLYEVTTLKPLDAWLADIMNSFRFLN